MKIWEHNSYRDYLLERLGNEGSRTGLRKKLAAAIPVHTTFVSQVLKGRAEFSLEQAEAINIFLEHTEDEGEFFILLLLKDRAGSRALKNRFERKIKGMRQERANIGKRLSNANEISLKDRERFYSSYLYGAAHVLAAIPKFQTIEALSEALKLPRSQTQNVVDFLLRIQLLQIDGGKIIPGARHIHLKNDSAEFP